MRLLDGYAWAPGIRQGEVCGSRLETRSNLKCISMERLISLAVGGFQRFLTFI